MFLLKHSRAFLTLPFSFLWDGKEKSLHKGMWHCKLNKDDTVLDETQNRLFLTDKTIGWNRRAVS